MASADDYANWIVANADKKGTADFDTVVKAYQQAKQEEAASTAPAAATPPPQDYQRKPSIGERVRGVAYPVAEAVGAGLGGLVGTAAMPGAGTVAGSALGYAGVKGVENLIDQYTGAARPETLGQAAARTAGDVATGATYEMGGQLLGTIPSLAAKGGVGIWNYLSPKAKVYLAATEGRGQDILNALRGQTTLVPGSMPTAAQAASGVGATKFAALGSEAANIMPTEYFQRAEAQKAAQLAAIRGVGQTPEALAAAQAAREATARNTYGISDKALLPGRERQFVPEVIGTTKAIPRTTAEGLPVMEEAGRDAITNAPIMRPSMSIGGQPVTTLVAKGYKNDPQLQKLLDRPAIASAFNRAEQMAQNQGVSMFTAEGKLTGAGAQVVKTALDDAITTAPTSAIGKGETASILSAKQDFLKWVEDKIPTYKAAREIFEAQSAPINQMQVGQFLEKKLGPALGEETAKLKASTFATALEEAPRTIKKATGQDRFTELSQILKPDQLAAVNAVRDDLARAALTERQAAAASGQGKALVKAGTEELSTMRMPNLLSRVTAVANDIMQRLQGKIDRKLAMELATEMLNPKTAAAGIENALKRQQLGIISPQNQLMMNVGAKAATFGGNALLNQGQQ